MTPPILAALACLFALPTRAPVEAGGDGEAADPPARLAPGALRIDRGEGRLPLYVPPAEELTFQAKVSIGPVRGARVGNVALISGVEPYIEGLPLPGQAPPDDGRRVGWLKAIARGGHLGYELDQEYVARILPTEWPSVLYRDTQRGSENRRRELTIGLRDGEVHSIYRSDRHCPGCERREHFIEGAFPWDSDRHCPKCKRAEHRVWREPQERTLPPGTVDMMRAVYLSRTMLLEDRQSADFPLIDRTRLWNVHLERRERAEIRVPAGRFDCYRVELSTTLPPGEPPTKSGFSALFGIRGDIDIWVHAETGVPVVIEGEVPLGPITLGARVELASYRGTPPAFRSVRRGR